MNIKHIQNLLSRIDEIKIIGKTAEIDGVVCNIAGIVRYGQKLRLVILEYDEVYRQKVEEMEMSEICEDRQQETNRSILKGRGRIEAAQPFIPIKSFIDVCPKGMYYPVIEYESEDDISLEFHTKKFLDSKPVHHGNGSVGFIIRPDIPTGILGMKLKAAIIQEPVLGSTEIIEAELFQYHKTVTPKDIILPEVETLKENNNDCMKVNVKEIAERLDMQFDEWLYFLDKRTGDIFEVEERFLRIAEELDEDDNLEKYLDWEKNTIQCAIKFYQEEKHYISLPSKYDIHEYQIMEDFIDSLTNTSHINRLERAITGKGAFRRFKDTINYLGIEKKWYDFKRKVLENIVIEWCKDNDLIY